MLVRCFAPGPVVGRGAPGIAPQGANMDAVTKRQKHFFWVECWSGCLGAKSCFDFYMFCSKKIRHPIGWILFDSSYRHVNLLTFGRGGSCRQSTMSLQDCGLSITLLGIKRWRLLKAPLEIEWWLAYKNDAYLVLIAFNGIIQEFIDNLWMDASLKFVNENKLDSLTFHWYSTGWFELRRSWCMVFWIIRSTIHFVNETNLSSLTFFAAGKGCVLLKSGLWFWGRTKILTIVK